MMRFARDFRLIPIVLLATVCLLALKVSGIIFDGGYTLAERMQNRYKTDMKVVPAESVPDHPKIVFTDGKTPDLSLSAPKQKQSWASEMFNYGDSHDVTGSIDSEPKSAGPPLKVETKAPGPPKLEAGGTTITIAANTMTSPGERAILERLQQRRKDLDARGRDLDMRESLLKATEKRVEAKVAELKAMEERIKAAMGERDKQAAERFKSIVAMYENMKAKDAARIFERLDMKILIDVSTHMNPRKMSDILAQMTPESAERLTVELANHAGTAKSADANKLPKIQGKPTGQ